VQFGIQLHAMRFADERVTRSISARTASTSRRRRCILAVPPYAAAALIPGIENPNEYRAIVNAHFRMDPPVQLPPIFGVVNATTEWIFAFRAASR
jgi:hypothetical protein